MKAMSSFKCLRRLVTGLSLLATAVPALAVPTITATPNPVIIPEGQTEGRTTITWDAGPNYATARVWSQTDKGDDSLFAASSKGALEAPVTLGKPITFKLYSGDGAQVLASTTVTAQHAQPKIPARKLPETTSKISPITAIANSFIQNVSADSFVAATGNCVRIAFTTREPANCSIEMAARPCNDVADATAAGQRPGPAFPPGAVTITRNDAPGPKPQHSYRVDGLAPDRTYYYVITAAGADGRTYRYWDTVKTLYSRRVRLVFERVHFTFKSLYPSDLAHGNPNGLQAQAAANDEWGTPYTGYWRYPRDGSWADLNVPVDWDVNIEAVVDRAADQLLLRLLVMDEFCRYPQVVSGNDINPDPVYPADPRPWGGRPVDYGSFGGTAEEPNWTTATGSLDTTMDGTNRAASGSFRLPLSPNQLPLSPVATDLRMRFEVTGRFEVSYVKLPILLVTKAGIENRHPVPGRTYRDALVTSVGKEKRGSAQQFLIPGQSALDALAIKGEALGNADPRAAELRSRQPDIPSRRGFDIGMAASEGNTAAGPGQQSIHDALRRPEQGGFETAAGYSLERNKYAALAAVGAAIAKADATVQKARTADPAVLYWLGFDIATGLFGDPALGAQGSTSTGPGSMRIRDSLSAAGQRGFNASVAFHLSRNYKH